MFLLGGLPEPPEGLGMALLHTLTVFILDTEVVLTAVMFLLSGGGRSGGRWTGSSARNQGKEERGNASEAAPRKPAPLEERANTGLHCLEGPEELGPPV